MCPIFKMGGLINTATTHHEIAALLTCIGKILDLLEARGTVKSDIRGQHSSDFCSRGWEKAGCYFTNAKRMSQMSAVELL